MRTIIYVAENLLAGHGASNTALIAAAEDYCRIENIFSRDFTISKNTFGKPYFGHIPELYFSLSHSGCYWLCAFAAMPLGLDIQQYRNVRYLDIARRFFSASEYSFVSALPDDERELAFFRIWAAKEAYVKYLGTGFATDLRSFCVLSGEAPRDIVWQYPAIHPDYAAAVCSGESAEISFRPLPF